MLTARLISKNKAAALWKRAGLGLLARLIRDRSGVVSVELALVSVFLAFVAMGTYDFARYGIESVRVTQAARAGLQFALHDPSKATDKSAIEKAVRDGADDDDSELTVVVGTPFCACPGHVAATCGSTCADGQYALEYVDLTVQSSIEMLFNYPGLPASIPISTTSQVRLN